MRIVEPDRSEKKLVEYLDENVKKVLIFFWHGLGDLIMFLRPFEQLKSLYPTVRFDLALGKGLGQEEVYPSATLVKAEEKSRSTSHLLKESHWMLVSWQTFFRLNAL